MILGKALLYRSSYVPLGGMTELKIKDTKSPMLFSADCYQFLVMPVVMPESRAVAEAKAVVREGRGRLNSLRL